MKQLIYRAAKVAADRTALARISFIGATIAWSHCASIRVPTANDVMRAHILESEVHRARVVYERESARWLRLERAAQRAASRRLAAFEADYEPARAG